MLVTRGDSDPTETGDGALGRGCETSDERRSARERSRREKNGARPMQVTESGRIKKGKANKPATEMEVCINEEGWEDEEEEEEGKEGQENRY